jgi:adenosylcobinamide amidohydrolase
MSQTPPDIITEDNMLVKAYAEVLCTAQPSKTICSAIWALEKNTRAVFGTNTDSTLQ